MHLIFKRSVSLRSGIDQKSKDFRRGVHDVPEEFMKDPHFVKLVQLGLVEEAEIAKIITPESQKKRNERLLNKLLAPKVSHVVAPSTAEKPAVSAVDVTPPAAPAVDAPSDTQKAQQEADDAELARMEAEEKAALDAKAAKKVEEKPVVEAKPRGRGGR